MILSCKKVEKKISAYFDNELSSKEKETVTEHINSCLQCQKQLDELSKLEGILSEYPEHDLPTYLENRLLNIPKQIDKRQLRWHNFVYYLKPLPVAASLLFSLFSALYVGNLATNTETTASEDIEFAQESLYTVWEGINYE